MLDPLEPFTEGPEEYDASSSTPTAGGAAMREVEENHLLVIKFLRLSTDAGEDTLTNDTKSKKGIIGSEPRGNPQCAERPQL